MADPIRVAILGGGPAGLAAAWELTAPTQKEKYAVTVYQLGWRLGGKCASGRDRDDHCRIQEHGLHVLFGYYDNTFEVLEEAYQTLAASGPEKFKSIYEALQPSSHITLGENIDGKWENWNIEAPVMPGRPGAGDAPDLWQGLLNLLKLAKSYFEHFTDHLHKLQRADDFAHSVSLDRRRYDFDTHRELARLLDDASKVIEDLWRGLGFESWWNHLKLELRRAFILLDLIFTLAKGALLSGFIFAPDRAVATLNEQDFRRWLSDTGARSVTVHSAVVRGLYDLTLAYPDGNSDGPGNLAAGSTLSGLFQMVRYRGAFMWKMRAGTGDIVAAPMYKALRARGVQFEFFCRVDELVPALFQDQIASVRIGKQVRLKNGAYEPLFTCEGLSVWPSEPDYSQIIEGEKLRNERIDLESYWTTWKDTGKPIELRYGADFDVLVLAIPIDGLHRICAQLIANKSDWQQMMAAVKTVQSQNTQLLFQVPGTELGPLPTGTVIGAYNSSPLDTGADISEVLPAESWPDDAKMHLTIQSAALPGPPTAPPPSEHNYPDQARMQVLAARNTFIAMSAPTLWPNIASIGGFDYEALWAPPGLGGPMRLGGQYVRANIDPGQRYTLSVAGSTRYRLRSDRSTYDNLYLAGDWTDNPGNLGSLEYAVMSGRLASRAISGLPKRIARVPADSPYYDQRPPYKNPNQAPIFVEYNGVQTFPGPFFFKNVDSWAFFLPADYGKLVNLCDTMFNIPSRGAVSYVPLSHMMMLSFIDITQARTIYDTDASGAFECEAALWVLLGRRRSPESNEIVDIAGFTPYLIINNPAGFFEGRVLWGYDKQAGLVSLPNLEESTHNFTVDAYGVRDNAFSTPWNYLRLMTLNAASSQEKSPPVQWHGMAEAVAQVKSNLAPENARLRPTWSLAENLLEDFLFKRAPQVFLKQFRNIAEPQRAVFQSITQAPFTIQKVEGVTITRPYRLQISDLFNAALTETLGVAAQSDLSFGLHFTMDFALQNGTHLWQANVSS